METGGAPSAYGASLAGGAFDIWALVKQPQTITRLLSWLCAVVVFGSITGEGFLNQIHSPDPVCVFNQNDAACHYAVGVGVLAFMACVAFLVLDAYFPHISNARERKHIVMADLVFSGVWAGLWFVCFCLLVNQWSQTSHKDWLPVAAARAAIAFSFFSILSWCLLVFFALRRFLLGVAVIGQDYADSAQSQAPPPYPGDAPERFQQAPFSSNPEPQEELPSPVF
ncbi:synaptogyrin-2-like [Conger conger]|uniref:synaptogyrin-2-like n=1 Tax=Conger conger TaxID=82655 RepID=UPI002A59B115|nr:synaptogyrin-2-like [Conger conger]